MDGETTIISQVKNIQDASLMTKSMDTADITFYLVQNMKETGVVG